MSDDQRENESASLSRALRLNAFCNRFEAAWQATNAARAQTREVTAGSNAEGLEGAPEPPRIEDFLSLALEEDRGSLLRELVLLEIHYRNARGDQCCAEEYRERFPGLQEE